MKSVFLKILPFFLILLLVYACSKEGEKTSKSMLPPASGKPGEMIVVMDSAQWAGSLGETVRQTFQAEVKGLPRDEKMFKLNRVDPGNLTRILKTVRNLMFVVTLDRNSADARRIKNFFTDESIDKIKTDPNLFVFTASDEFARGQNVMYLFGQTESLLIKQIRQNARQLQNYFNNAEYDRLSARVFEGKNTQGLTKVLEEQHQCTMQLPFNYKLVMSEPGFVWFRQINDDNDKDIFISYREYTNENMFEKEQLIQFRDSTCQQFIFEDPEKPDTYLITETKVPYIPVTVENVSFHDHYAVRMNGLWRTNNPSMGGPFLGYAMVDQALNRFYYIEGFVYSPGKSQREYMREMDVVLHSFHISKEGQKVAAEGAEQEEPSSGEPADTLGSPADTLIN